MTAHRPLRVKQRESGAGQFWYVVCGGNTQVLTTSEMYPSRSNAIRAARRFIKVIAPVPVLFTYWTGGRHPGTDLPRRVATERIRFDQPAPS